ncbi:MAG: CBS domain-containing protein, partial [Pseudomonadota bacterium]
RVAEVMDRSPRLIDGLATVREALDAMRTGRVDYLVIDKRDEHDEYALVSVHDIAEHVIARDRAIDRTSVYEIMTKPVMAVDAGMNVKYAIRLLCRFHLVRALVLAEGKLAGIVTLRDMALRTADGAAEPTSA